MLFSTMLKKSSFVLPVLPAEMFICGDPMM